MPTSLNRASSCKSVEMTHACHKIPFPPTCVDHCVRANFVSENETNLIVARSSLLQIYVMRANVSRLLLICHLFLLRQSLEVHAEKGEASLDLLCEYNLFGNIEGFVSFLRLDLELNA